jgi:HD-like signal output (HDOD) protein
MKTLLIVDDDPATAAQLRKILADLSADWHIEDVGTPDEALAAMGRGTVDVVLANTHLGGTGGLQLLSDVKTRYPQTIRLATSAAAHRSVIMRALEVAHQFLPKPIEPGGLKAALARTRSFREQVANESLRRLIADIRTIPSLPGIYQELVAALQSPQASVETAATIISKDMAMVSKILQVVNSAYFSLRRTISSPAHAIALLGIDTIKSLVLSLQVFSQFNQSGDLPVSIDALWRHGMATGSAAKAIAKSEGVGALGVEGAFIAGLVHDIGVLVLGTNFPEQYQDVLRISRRQGLAVWSAEQEVFGASHSEVAGYLLGIWGLNEAVVEAVTYHHNPTARPQQGFSVLTAVYAANAIDEERDATLSPESRTLLDPEYFASCGLMDRVSGWRERTSQAA